MAEDNKVSTGTDPGERRDTNVGAEPSSPPDLVALKAQLLDALLSAQPRADVLMIPGTERGPEARRLIERANSVAAGIEEQRTAARLVGLLVQHVTGTALSDALAFFSMASTGGSRASASSILSMLGAKHVSDGSLLGALIDLELEPDVARSTAALRQQLKTHFHDRLSRKALRLAKPLAGTADGAEDVAHQALLKLIEQKGEEKALVLWWLINRAVPWRWVEMRRRDGADRFVSLEEHHHLPSSDTPEMRLMWREVVQIVEEELGELSARDRRILIELGDGATPDELRPILQDSARGGGHPVSDGAIKRAKTRARERLRKVLPRAVKSVVEAPSDRPKADSEEET
jgi:DNA-directed RNA polymerase specialized sigma24 family protein